MKWHPAYQKLLDKRRQENDRTLVRLTIELSRTEAEQIMAIARQAKVSRKKWIERLVRKELHEGDSDDGSDD
jgi:hypothetical protein